MATMKWSADDWARLGAVIRKSREAQGYSRKKLSVASGVSEKSIQLTEEGRVPTRWPQSLGAIEEALGWAPGSMRSVLEGDDVEYQMPLVGGPTIPALAAGAAVQGEAALTAKATFTAAGEVTPSAAWWVNQFAHMDLPDDLRKALPQVMYFATAAVRQGADDWSANTFTNIVYLMLEQVSASRREQALAARPTPTTEEETEERLAELDVERKRLLAGIQAMETLLDQTPRGPEEEMSAGERENRAELTRLKELLEKMGTEQENPEGQRFQSNTTAS